MPALPANPADIRDIPTEPTCLPMTPRRDASTNSLLEEFRVHITELSVVAAQRHEDIVTRLMHQEQLFKNIWEQLQFSDKLPLEPELSTLPISAMPHSGTNTVLTVRSPDRRSTTRSTGNPRSKSTVSDSASSKHSYHEAVRRLSKTQNIDLPQVISNDSMLNSLPIWKRLNNLAKSDRFEILVSTLILMSAVSLCADVQYNGLDVCFNLGFKGCSHSARTAWPAGERVLQIADLCFGVLFCLEAALKIIVMRCDYFAEWPGWLDFFCVNIFVFDKCVKAQLINTNVNANVLRLLRLVRLARLTRLFKKLEAFDSLFVMVASISSMRKILMWAIALLSMLLMSVALFLSQMLHATYFSDVVSNEMSTVELQKHQKLFEYYGTFTRCIFTVFELTLANYPPAARLLAEEVSEWFMLVVLLHKLTVGFAVVGVLNGVILQETFKVASTQDTIMSRQKAKAAKTMRKKMEGLFELLDINKSGSIEFKEFQLIAALPEVQTWLGSMGIETDDLETLFVLIDVENDKHITVEELISRLSRICGAAKGIDLLALDLKLQRSAVQLPALSVDEPRQQTGNVGGCCSN